MNVIEQVRQHDAYHAEDATRECGDRCEFEPIFPPLPACGISGCAVPDHQKRQMLNSGLRAAPGVPDPKLCPARVQSSLEGYVRGLPPGDFVRAVLSNDLNEAIARADDVNIHALLHIVAYVREHLPAVAWGSSEKVNRWLSKGRDATGPLRTETAKEYSERSGIPLAENESERES